jgi:hypothetical protein
MVEGLFSIAIDPVFLNPSHPSYTSRPTNTAATHRHWKCLSSDPDSKSRDHRNANTISHVMPSLESSGSTSAAPPPPLNSNTPSSKKKGNVATTGLRFLLRGTRLNLQLENALEFIWVGSNAAVIIQRAYIKYYPNIVARRARRETACIKLQYEVRKFLYRLKRANFLKTYRARQIQREYRRHYMHRVRATIVLQRYMRGWIVRLTIKVNRAAATIASFFQWAVAKMRFLRIREATVVLQRAWRRYQIIKLKEVQQESATVIQRCYRQYRSRLLTQRWNTSATRIQCHYRRSICMRRYRKWRNAVTKIKSFLLMHMRSESFKRMKVRVLQIQTWYRAAFAVRAYRQTLSSIVLLQSFSRGTILHRRRFKDLRMKTIIIQKFTRCYLTRKRFVKIKESALVLQQSWRVRYQVKLQKKRENAIVYLQYKFRKRLKTIRRRLQEAAAIVLQRRIREHLAHRRCMKLRIKGVCLAVYLWKKYERRWIARKAEDRALWARRTIIKNYRAYRMRRRIKRHGEIRKKLRFIEENYLHRKKERAARQFQRLWRRHRIFVQKTKAIILVQSCWRKHRDYKLYRQLKEEIAAILSIEKRISSALERKKSSVHKGTRRAMKERRKHAFSISHTQAASANAARDRLGLAWGQYL